MDKFITNNTGSRASLIKSAMATVNQQIFWLATINLAITAYVYSASSPTNWLTLVHPSLITSIGLVMLLLAGLECNRLFAYIAAGDIVVAWFSHLILWLSTEDASYITPKVHSIPLVLHILNMCAVASIALSGYVSSRATFFSDKDSQED
jgi:hypothetical protein